MTNRITVCGHRVLVRITLSEVNKNLKNGERIIDGKIYSAGGLVLGEANIKDEARAAQQGVVVALGPEAYDIKTDKWCKVGDRVFFTRYAGKEIDGALVGEDGVVYTILNDEDIFAILHD